jgi:hypothetical protein
MDGSGLRLEHQFLDYTAFPLNPRIANPAQNCFRRFPALNHPPRFAIEKKW